ncbi:MAG: hypothetical protein K8R59_02095 [Thermoanaerobaculales bacterium]|nr:hypothetical protein [Thermoanaerobaculales bacterium]
MSKKPRKKKKKMSATVKRTDGKSEYYSGWELFMAGLGVAFLVLAAGLIITSLLN